MNKTNDWIQSLIEGAPEGATHYHHTTYLRYDGETWVWWNEEHNWCFVDKNSLGWAQNLGGCHGSLSDLREILTLRQRVQELDSQLPKWISVEEGLPEEKQHILMLDDCGGKYSGRGSVLIATNDSDEPSFGTRMRYTHWMPFPQPPTGEENDK